MKTFLKQISFIMAVLCSLIGWFAIGCEQPKEQIFIHSSDVGDCQIEGSLRYDPTKDTYTLKGAGFNLWGENDAFYYAWKEVEGDFVLTADIAFGRKKENSNGHRKLGLQIRETLDADSPYADIAIHGDGLTSLQYRLTKGGDTQHIKSDNQTPAQIQIERKGNIIIARTDSNITSIRAKDGEVEIQLPAKCYVGLFICSHEDYISETAYFSGVVLH
ncbi:hypothetical protein EZS27_030410 [termite gut metagenome]|uniref:Uncharacterized protein n=1 Tax=termite gut metagenome TaxID=433724 RepID=A0A5J4QCL3_9ZZZZ